MSKGSTLCWYCSRFGGGCIWSRVFGPVPGWYAKDTGSKNNGVWVGWCPEWELDEGLLDILLQRDKSILEIRRQMKGIHGMIEPHERVAAMKYHAQRMFE